MKKEEKSPIDHEFTAIKLRGLFELIVGWENLRLRRINRYDDDINSGVEMVITEMAMNLCDAVDEMEGFILTLYKQGRLTEAEKGVSK
ncbi:MAG: hypothetical protein WCW84_10515 [Sulfurimonas sp.]|jgi:hypothetical protein